MFDRDEIASIAASPEGGEITLLTNRENGNPDTERSMRPTVYCGKIDRKYERLKKLCCQLGIEIKASLNCLKQSDNQTH